MKMLLHACCGPCSLEPVRLLQERGIDVTIAFINDNITPREEYDRRFAELCAFAQSKHIEVVGGAYNPDAWESEVGALGESLAAEHDLSLGIECASSVSELLDDANRAIRCRACYRMRLTQAAKLAYDSGFDTLATTLAVSPYQFTDIIGEELERAAASVGVSAFFEDWRPYYDNATRESRALGMYRQNYCGCRFSVEEGAATRAFVKRQAKQRKEQQRQQQASERAQRQADEAARAAARRAYQSKQERKRAILKALREQKDEPTTS